MNRCGVAELAAAGVGTFVKVPLYIGSHARFASAAARLLVRSSSLPVPLPTLTAARLCPMLQGESVSRLWRPFRTRARGGYPVPLLPVEPPTEPEACLQSMLAMARLLIEVRLCSSTWGLRGRAAGGCATACVADVQVLARPSLPAAHCAATPV